MASKTKQPSDMPRRCPWAEEDSLLAKYHDEEWGVPVKTDAAHFERLSLEVFQAGLSWRTILVHGIAAIVLGQEGLG